MEITRKELIEKYLKFFERNKHAIIPDSSIVPQNDPTVLFTTAGMQPLVPFLLGEKHPLGKRLVNVQKCIRTGDIDSVGDNFHLTFFEMLGNWSLGDYFKEEAIKLTFEFLTKELKIPIENLAVSVFEGNEFSEKDNESFAVWKSLGIKEERIAFLPKENNWWEHPSNGTPCGPCTEIFYWVGKGKPKGNPKTNEAEWAEIGNDVLMGFTKISENNYKVAKQKNIDFGGGCERILTVLNGKESVYDTNIFVPILKKIEKISGKKYSENKKEMRIIADHLKAAVFMISEGVVPSNSERGYVLRRLLRRAVRQARHLELKDFTSKVSESVFEVYEDEKSLQKNKPKVLEELKKEEEKFNQTIEQGFKIFNKIVQDSKVISGKDAFLLYQSYGFPLELIIEEATSKKIKVNEKEFEEENKKHQELSRTASAGQFKSGLADDSEMTKKLHTATHMLNEALRVVLSKKDLHQKGSNITPERLRFDFSFDRKLTEEELKKVEELVNKKIKEKLSVKCTEMSLDEAKKKGAQGVFESKYGNTVRVYEIGDFSKELCAGPHVENTSQLGHFKITKEEASAAGVRRIKAVLD